MEEEEELDPTMSFIMRELLMDSRQARHIYGIIYCLKEIRYDKSDSLLCSDFIDHNTGLIKTLHFIIKDNIIILPYNVSFNKP
jgi:hypothetical protein